MIRVPLELPLTERDLDTLHDLMQAGGFPTIEAVVLHALRMLGRHYDRPLGHTDFAGEPDR